jgi:hypothetical protein
MFNLAGVIGLLVAGPLLFGGHYFNNVLIQLIGFDLWWLCGLTMAVSWAIFMIGLVRGKYKKLEERPWHEQVW